MGLKFLSRLFSGRNSETPARRCMVEPLEKRQLLTLTVAGMLADNRGSVQIVLGGDAEPTSVHRTSVQVYTTGPDGIIYTADDVFVPSAIRYYASIRRISINFDLPSNTQYRVKLVSSRIRELGSGDMLDGEYNNTFPTGNGIPGGNTEFTVLHDRSATPLVRMSTSAGVITLKVYRGLKPNTASHFLGKVNSGDYDNIFFTRAIQDFIVQLGSLKIDEQNMVVAPDAGPTLANEFDTNPLSNLRGTLAFARVGGEPDSATNQFFFNLADNAGLDGVDGGFTIFAEVVNQNSLDVIDAIGNRDDVALNNPNMGPFNEVGVLPFFPGTGLTNVPINSISKYDGFGAFDDIDPDPNNIEDQFVVTGNFNPTTDTVVVGRTSMLYKIRSLTAK